MLQFQVLASGSALGLLGERRWLRIKEGASSSHGYFPSPTIFSLPWEPRQRLTSMPLIASYRAWGLGSASLRCLSQRLNGSHHSDIWPARLKIALSPPKSATRARTTQDPFSKASEIRCQPTNPEGWVRRMPQPLARGQKRGPGATDNKVRSAIREQISPNHRSHPSAGFFLGSSRLCRIASQWRGRMPCKFWRACCHSPSAHRSGHGRSN